MRIHDSHRQRQHRAQQPSRGVTQPSSNNTRIRPAQLHGMRATSAAAALSTIALDGDNADDYSTQLYLDGQGPFAGTWTRAAPSSASRATKRLVATCTTTLRRWWAIKVVYGERILVRRRLRATTSPRRRTTSRITSSAPTSAKGHDDLRAHAERGRVTAAAAPTRRACQRYAGLTAAKSRLTAGSPPLLEVLFATHADVDPLFGLQCRCVEINKCVGCTRQFGTKSFLGDDAAILARSSGEEPASPRHRAGIASMAWRTTRRFSTNAP